MKPRILMHQYFPIKGEGPRYCMTAAIGHHVPPVPTPISLVVFLVTASPTSHDLLQPPPPLTVGHPPHYLHPKSSNMMPLLPCLPPSVPPPLPTSYVCCDDSLNNFGTHLPLCSVIGTTLPSSLRLSLRANLNGDPYPKLG
jgi:hypothetical protein